MLLYKCKIIMEDKNMIHVRRDKSRLLENIVYPDVLLSVSLSLQADGSRWSLCSLLTVSVKFLQLIGNADRWCGMYI